MFSCLATFKKIAGTAPYPTKFAQINQGLINYLKAANAHIKSLEQKEQANQGTWTEENSQVPDEEELAQVPDEEELADD